VDLVNEALHLFVPRRSTQSDGGGSVLPCADATCPGPPSLRYADGRGTQHGVRDGGALQR
jgi:hypothetical protein